MSIKWQLPIDPHGIDSVFDGSGVATAGPEYGGLEFRSNMGGLVQESYADQLVAQSGVFGDRHFKVSVSGTSVIVDGGQGVIGTGSGVYPFSMNGSQTLGSLTVADTNYSRIDRVVVRVDDPTTGGAADRCGFIQVIDGTPAASPAAPVVSGTSVYLDLAEITVPKNGSGTPSVRDTRKFTVATGGVRRVMTSGEVAQSVPIGCLAYDAQAGRLKLRKSTGVVELREHTETSATSGVATAASGWSIETQMFTKMNGVVYGRITAKRTGGDIPGNLSGNITNVTMCNIAAAYRPKYEAPISSGTTGPVLTGGITTSGDLDIGAGSGNTGVMLVSTNDTISFNFTYLAATY